MDSVNAGPIYRQATLSSTEGSFRSGFLSRILVAIPCYNEEITIGSLVLKAKKYADEVLVINDGSSDATAEIAEKAGAVIIPHLENKGKAASIMTAVQYAKAKEYDVLVFLDGDGQHNPDEIPTVLNPIITNGADVVIGSRFLTNGNGTNHVPSYRRVGQKTLDIASNITSAFKSTDSQSGFRALSRKAFLTLNFISDGYNIESDMLRHLSEKGLAIGEVPIRVRYDTPNGHKKDPLAHGFDILAHLIGLVSYRRPLLAFGIPGFALTMAGLFLGIYVLSIYFTSGVFHYLLFMGGVVALILGLLFVTAAFTLNSIKYVLIHIKR